MEHGNYTRLSTTVHNETCKLVVPLLNLLLPRNKVIWSSITIGNVLWLVAVFNCRRSNSMILNLCNVVPLGVS